MNVMINRTQYTIDKESLKTSLTGIAPNVGGKYFIEIAGKTFPIRQAVAAALHVPAIGLSTNHCFAILAKLGFEVTEVN